jgi:hypothetical protein
MRHTVCHTHTFAWQIKVDSTFTMQKALSTDTLYYTLHYFGECVPNAIMLASTLEREGRERRLLQRKCIRALILLFENLMTDSCLAILNPKP